MEDSHAKNRDLFKYVLLVKKIPQHQDICKDLPAHSNLQVKMGVENSTETKTWTYSAIANKLTKLFQIQGFLVYNWLKS